MRQREDKVPFRLDSREAFGQLEGGFELEDAPGQLLLVKPPRQWQPGDGNDVSIHYPEVATGRRLYLYRPRNAGDESLVRVVTVHYDATESVVATQVAKIAAVFLLLHRTHFARPTQFATVGVDDNEAHVWLASQTPLGKEIGGMTRANHVYVFGSGPVLPADERLRTLAHEWGHLTLSQVCAKGFTSPESDASGYTGERLYLKWLHEYSEYSNSKENKESLEGVDKAFLTLYYNRQIKPLMDQYNAIGPSSVKPLTAAGMNKYVGMVLATDEAVGGLLLAKGLFDRDTFRPEDLTNSLSKNITDAPSYSVKLPAWVPFIPVNYQGGLSSGKGNIQVGKQSINLPTRWKATPGWHYVTCKTPNGRLTLTRK
jgi:hypothetical protein